MFACAHMGATHTLNWQQHQAHGELQSCDRRLADAVYNWFLSRHWHLGHEWPSYVGVKWLDQNPLIGYLSHAAQYLIQTHPQLTPASGHKKQ